MLGDPRPAPLLDDQQSHKSIRAEILKRSREASEKTQGEPAARRAAGMGFWRLVWIVALGILVAQAIAAVATLLIRWLTGSA